MEFEPADDVTFYHKGKVTRTRARNFGEDEFIAWDGEGITPEGQHRQNFVLFGNSKGMFLKGYALSTLECLNLMMTTEEQYPRGIHVGFAFGYDTEMILRDVPMKNLQVLHRRGAVRWKGYRIEFRKGKWLQVTRRNRETGDITCCRIWDVWSFFSTSFAVAIREYLGDIPELAKIESGKAGRQQFTYDELDTVIEPYWKSELALTVELITTLRKRLYDADLKIRHWHGPGAIATYAMRQRNVASLMSREIPPDVSLASQYAYAGGRFELFKLGRHPTNVYAYDIRSAYPNAITKLPNLAKGEWRYVDHPQNIARFGVYRISFSNTELFTQRPMPYFYRDERYAIHYPNRVEGWYWSPEANIARILGNDVEIIDGYEFSDDGSTPFEWVRDVYNTRAEWKRAGNPSQIALKLLMNSMYGKFAQRVGWERFNGPPKWHQLEWAGYVTSYARSMLYHAMLQAHRKKSLIGVETDGIFSSEPLDLDIGPNLGQWEADEYEEMIYLQSGFYFKKQQGQWKSKYRGFDRGSITVEDTISALAKWRPWENESHATILGTTTRFSAMGMYLRMPGGEQWRNTWTTSPRDLNIGTDGKRVHSSAVCSACANHISPADGLHGLAISHPVGGTSIPHSLPWVGKDENHFREIQEAESYA